MTWSEYMASIGDLEYAAQDLAAIRAAAEPVREWLKAFEGQIQYNDYFTASYDSEQLGQLRALLDAIGKPETAQEAPGAHDTPPEAPSRQPTPSVAPQAPGLAGIGIAGSTQPDAPPYPRYFSTYCLQGNHVHCRKTWYSPKAPCLCECHEAGGKQDA